MNTVEDVVRSLEAIGERLTEMAIDVLRDAVEEGSSDRPLGEKALTQARRAVEKAIHVLSSIGDDPGAARD